MTNLSPAAQAVVAAIEKFDWEAGHFSREEIWFCSREVVAAALRAAADQVVPQITIAPQQDLESRREAMEWGMNSQTQLTRHQLLRIAAELEGAQ